MSKAVAKVTPGSPPAPQSEAASMFSMIERMATDTSVSIDRVEQAFTFYQKVRDDQARKAFTSAFIAAQMEMEPVRKAADNPQTRSKYATFEALDAAVRPIYTRHGFGVTFSTAESNKPDHIKVICHILHADGFERDYPLDVPADGKGAKGGDVMTKTHATGSAITYGKRYTFGAAWNIITTERDDDGNKAGGAGGTITAKQVAELDALIEATGSDKVKFLAIGNLTALEDMPARDFEKAKAVLINKMTKGRT